MIRDTPEQEIKRCIEEVKAQGYAILLDARERMASFPADLQAIIGFRQVEPDPV